MPKGFDRTNGVRALRRLIKRQGGEPAVWSMLDALPVAVAFWDADGCLLGWNRSSERLFGRPGRGFVGQHFTKLFPEGRWRSRVALKLFAKIHRQSRLEFESWRLRGDGRPIWVNTILRRVRDRKSYWGTISIYRDMTKRQAAQLALRQSERRFRLLADACLSGVVVHEKGRIRLVNRTMGKISGIPSAKLPGRVWHDFVAAQDRRRARSLKTGGFQTTLRRPDGRLVPVICQARMISWNGAPMQLVVVKDLSDAAHATEAKAVALRLQQAEENERHRVSRELHDGVAQLLTTASSAAKTLREEIRESSPESFPTARRAAAALALALAEVRRISKNMRPFALDDFGLSKALRSLGEEFSERARVPLRVSIGKKVRRLPPELELALYRVAQESLSNVERHARARKAKLLLTQRGRKVILEISDDGRGFNPAVSAKGQGLRNIQERTRLLGGEVELESAPRRGTSIRAAFHLP